MTSLLRGVSMYFFSLLFLFFVRFSKIFFTPLYLSHILFSRSRRKLLTAMSDLTVLFGLIGVAGRLSRFR